MVLFQKYCIFAKNDFGMKEYFYLLSISILLTINTFAQNKREINSMSKAQSPISDSTGLISYSKTVKTELPDSIIFKRALHWYNTAIKSMRIQSEANKKFNLVVAKGEFDLLGPEEGGSQPKAGRIKYTMKTYIKDGSFTTEITRFNIQNTIYTPIETWIKTQEEDYKYKYYLIYIEEQSESILNSFVEMVNVKMYNRN